MEEFNPRQYLTQLVNTWWIAVITTLLGGLAGYVWSTFRPPIYQATASFVVTLDMEKGKGVIITEYDRDMAVGTITAALFAPDVIADLITESYHLGIALNQEYVMANQVIERRFETWLISIRSTDPEISQETTNLWARKAYAKMVLMSASGNIPGYVLFNPPLLATYPQKPARFPPDQPILAGGVVGLVSGIFLCEVVIKRVLTHKPDA